MALPTVANINSDVGALLGDSSLEKYTAAEQLPFFGMAYRTVWDAAMNLGTQMVKREVTYTLPADTLVLTPATAGITDMGEPERLWERASTSDDWSLMTPVDTLSQFDSSDSLVEWKWEGDTFYFIGATGARLLKIEYTMSGVAPTTGTIAIDNSRTILGYITAALIAQSPLGGQPQMAALLFRQAYGPSMEPDGTGGVLRHFLNPMVKEQQKRPIVFPPFRRRRTWRGQ